MHYIPVQVMLSIYVLTPKARIADVESPAPTPFENNENPTNPKEVKIQIDTNSGESSTSAAQTVVPGNYSNPGGSKKRQSKETKVYPVLVEPKPTTVPKKDGDSENGGIKAKGTQPEGTGEPIAPTVLPQNNGSENGSCTDPDGTQPDDQGENSRGDSEPTVIPEVVVEVVKVDPPAVIEDPHEKEMKAIEESLKKPPVEPPKEPVHEKSESDDYRQFEEEMSDIIKKSPKEEETDRQLAELKRQEEEQKSHLVSCRVEDETENFEDREDDMWKEEKARHAREMEEQKRKHKEEIEEMKRNREEKQKQYEEELLEMRRELAERVKTMMYCCQLKMRFDSQKDEWTDILKGIWKPLIKVVTSFYNVEDEIRMSGRDEDSGAEILFEAKLFAKMVHNAQTSLAKSYDTLADMSEQHEDKIFLKMIMKPVSEEGFKCNEIGYKLVDLMDSPSNPDYQAELVDLVKKLDSHSIPTTSSLQERSKTARIEDYSNIPEAPYPDWFQRIP
uniref:Casc1_N domain-containing protein n=1 Tax=Caenorhabditis tropicalis TaxID=1561998 RepID=A0A1I7SY66_9PELO